MPSFLPANQSPYSVDSRREIIAILKGLQDSSQLVTLLINGGSELFITSILDVNQDNGTLIIDSVSGGEALQRVLRETSVCFESSLDRISIQFTAPYLVAVSFENRPALKLTLPRSLVRLQRREFYRINTPVTNPVHCTIELEAVGAKSLQCSLVDISCGGIALMDDSKTLEKAVGALYKSCKIDFPGIGVIEVALEVLNWQDLTLMNAIITRRVGLQYSNVAPSVLTNIQRYIMKLERERNAKL